MKMNANLTGYVLTHDLVWAIEPVAGDRLWKQLASISIEVHQEDIEVRGYAAAPVDRTYPVEDGGIAVISIVGPMTKSPTSMDSGVSTVRIRQQIRTAAVDPEVKGIMLRIDSPGGSVSGTGDLAKDVAIAASKKALMAYCEDSCCSAAYWVASQAGKIMANDTAIVGSIGTYMAIADSSEMYDAAGVKVHVLSTGQYKGAGVDGSPIPDEHLADFQRLVEDLNEHFLQGVAKGRGMDMSRVRELADGRVHVALNKGGGASARSLGLIDGVGSFDKAMSELRDLADAGKTKSVKADVEVDTVLAGTPFIVNLTNGARIAGRLDGDEFTPDQMQVGETLDLLKACLELDSYTISASDGPAPIAATFEATLETVRIAAESASERMKAVTDMRSTEGRAFSPARLEQAKSAHEAFGQAIAHAEALRPSGTPPDDTEDARARLRLLLVAHG